MRDKGSSENHIINNVKVVLDLAGFLALAKFEKPKIFLYESAEICQ
jgi:hypothetical protein